MTHYVYRYFDANDRLIYIGCSKDPWRRYKSHRADSRLWIGEVARGHISVYPDMASALEAEKAAIIAEKPAYNRQYRWDYRDDWDHQDYADYAAAYLHTSPDPRRSWRDSHMAAVRAEYRALFGRPLPIRPARRLRVAA